MKIELPGSMRSQLTVVPAEPQLQRMHNQPSNSANGGYVMWTCVPREDYRDLRGLANLQAVGLDILIDALRVIIAFYSSPNGCETFSSGDCNSAGRSRDAEFSADRWCNVCIARDALRRAGVAP